jgi:hypothetical protein
MPTKAQLQQLYLHWLTRVTQHESEHLYYDKSAASLYHQVPISPIFYEQLFCKKLFFAAFMCLKFGFVIFWCKDFGAKAAHKMLVKLTPGGSMGTRYILQLLFSEKSQNC